MPRTQTPLQDLRGYLDQGRAAVRWKVEGLDERSLRWPMTPTGTNLLGLVKHLTFLEFGYFGVSFGRFPPEPYASWTDTFIKTDDPTIDLYATRTESATEIRELYDAATAHADRTFETVELQAQGAVPWWPGTVVTLHQIMTHMVAETHRHAGHMDILRESIDSSVGLLPSSSNLAIPEQQLRSDYVAALQTIAEGC